MAWALHPKVKLEPHWSERLGEVIQLFHDRCPKRAVIQPNRIHTRYVTEVTTEAGALPTSGSLFQVQLEARLLLHSHPLPCPLPHPQPPGRINQHRLPGWTNQHLTPTSPLPHHQPPGQMRERLTPTSPLPHLHHLPHPLPCLPHTYLTVYLTPTSPSTSPTSPTSSSTSPTSPCISPLPHRLPHPYLTPASPPTSWVDKPAPHPYLSPTSPTSSTSSSTLPSSPLLPGWISQHLSPISPLPHPYLTSTSPLPRIYLTYIIYLTLYLAYTSPLPPGQISQHLIPTSPLPHLHHLPHPLSCLPHPYLAPTSPFTSPLPHLYLTYITYFILYNASCLVHTNICNQSELCVLGVRIRPPTALALGLAAHVAWLALALAFAVPARWGRWGAGG